nr:hypothetical protein [uncultured Noviherbaspirillum sp.]
MQINATNAVVLDAKLLEGFDKAAAAYVPAIDAPRDVMTVPFSEVPINGEFFDPHCGEVFVKVSQTRAQMASSGSDPGGPDSFSPDEMVEVTRVAVLEGA